MGMIGKLLRISEAELQQLQANEEDISDFIYSEDSEEKELDIDKAWHGIHYVLNKSAWEGELPLFNTIMGGTPIGEDMGYGPIRFLTGVEVKEVAAALAELSEEELQRRFDPEEMNDLDIYPSLDWSEAEEPEYIFSYLKEVRNYYLEAAGGGQAMLLYTI